MHALHRSGRKVVVGDCPSYTEVEINLASEYSDTSVLSQSPLRRARKQIDIHRSRCRRKYAISLSKAKCCRALSSRSHHAYARTHLAIRAIGWSSLLAHLHPPAHPRVS
jgi:hypothetical protein